MLNIILECFTRTKNLINEFENNKQSHPSVCFSGFKEQTYPFGLCFSGRWLCNRDQDSEFLATSQCICGQHVQWQGNGKINRRPKWAFHQKGTTRGQLKTMKLCPISLVAKFENSDNSKGCQESELTKTHTQIVEVGFCLISEVPSFIELTNCYLLI